MKKQNKNLTGAATLRHRAEEKQKNLKSKASLSLSESDILKLIHELEVHQIELEMQNEELVIAKEKAELAEEKYTELYDFAPSGYLTLSKTGEILELNFVAAKMLGKERSKLIKKQFNFFLSFETQKIFKVFLQEVFTKKTKQSCEVVLAIDGNLPIYIFIEGIVNHDDELCFLSLLDITKRKLAEQNLLESNLKMEESEDKFQQLVDNIDECFWLRTDDEMLYVSPGFEKIWGMPCQALYDNPGVFTEIIHPADKPSVMEIINSDNFRKNGIFDYDYRIIRADKEVRWINAKSFPVKNKKGEFIRRAGIAIDNTEKIRKHLELIKAKEKAEESDRLKSAFLANMSHEIRTPMNGILGFAGLLKEPHLTGEEQQQYIRIIEKSGERMLNTINDIIDISKIEAGLMTINISEFKIKDQLAFISDFFKPEAEKKKIELVCQVCSPDKNVVIKTDSEKFTEILTNLVKNALKYIETGFIEIGYLETEKFHQFYVKDTGIGIEKNRQKAIFDRFVQADILDTRAFQGSGLGLTISKAYVEMLGGEIWVESEFGKGSVFYFTIPNSKSETKKTNPLPAPVETISGKQVMDLKIMIVEDDPVSAMLLEIMLETYSTTILKAKTGLEAVEVVQLHPDLDLILMDIRIPEINGYEATRKIREINSEVIIIAQTAYGLSGDKEKAMEAGCNDYTSKPIKKEILFELINKWVIQKEKK